MFQRCLLFAAFLTISLSHFVSVSAQDSNSIMLRSLPEKCELAVCWLGTIKADPNGTTPEKWLGQPELQLMFAKLKTAMADYVNKSAVIDDELAQRLLTELPWIMMKQPWSISAPSLGGLRNAPENAAILLKLGPHEPMLSKLLEEYVYAESAGQKTLSGTVFHILPARRNVPEIHVGIHKNYFMCGIGEDAIARMFANAKSPTPKWVDAIRNRTPVDRLAGMLRLDSKTYFQNLVKGMGVNRRNAELFQALQLKQLIGLDVVIGIRNDNWLTHGVLKCDADSEGALSLFDAKPLDEVDLKQIPNSDSMVAFNFGIQGFWNSFSQMPQMDQANQEINVVIGQLFEGMDVKQLIDDYLTGHVYTYFPFDLINPNASSVVGVGIKNFDELQPKFQKLMDDLRGEPFGQQVEVKESNGFSVYNVAPAQGRMGLEVSYCLTESHFYFAANPRAIPSHLRKISRQSDAVADQIEIKQLFDDERNGGLGQPIGVAYLNAAKGLRLLHSISPMLGPILASEGIEFEVSDIADAQVLSKDVQLDCIGVYRDETGIHLVEYSTTPGVISIGLGSAVAGMIVPAANMLRASSQRVVSLNNMRQLVLASLNYEATFQRLPASYSVNPDGEPLLSWRVHVLPFLDHGELYREFNLDEPWNSPHNRKLIQRMPPVFENPKLKLKSGYTTYLGVSGKGGLFQPSTVANGLTNSFQSPIGFRDIVDGTSNTILIVEANEQNAVPWTKPSDLNMDQVKDLVEACSGIWPGKVNVAFCDGACQSLDQQKLDQEKLRAMMTRDGGETVSFD